MTTLELMLRNVGRAMLALCSAEEERTENIERSFELDERKNHHP
jgi:hypothetical protein